MRNAFASTYYQLQGAPQFNVAIVLLHTHILPFAMRKEILTIGYTFSLLSFRLLFFTLIWIGSSKSERRWYQTGQQYEIIQNH